MRRALSLLTAALLTVSLLSRGGVPAVAQTPAPPATTPASPAYELGVVLIQYDAAVYTAHLDAFSGGPPGVPSGLVNETGRPVAPVGVVHEFLIEHGFENPEVIARIDSLHTEVVRIGAGVDPHTVIDLLKAHPLAGVLHAQPNFLYHPFQVEGE